MNKEQREYIDKMLDKSFKSQKKFEADMKDETFRNQLKYIRERISPNGGKKPFNSDRK